MGKVKIKKKSTLIDMTAMSDVTVLLLTFFMLTSTFLQEEPVKVVTPSSVSEIKVPEMNLVTILVNPEGKVFLSFANDADSTYSNEKMRAELLKNVVAEYNDKRNANIQLTQKQINEFAGEYMFGQPIASLPGFLDIEVMDRKELRDPASNPNAGIPISINTDLTKPNEFQMWMSAAYKTSNQNLLAAIKDGSGIAIKADKDTPYDVIHVVMDNLQTMKMNRFSLMTALKSGGE
ncbi:MAG: biopolymer transporter ExbD [Bacteroidales bacterium]